MRNSRQAGRMALLPILYGHPRRRLPRDRTCLAHRVTHLDSLHGLGNGAHGAKVERGCSVPCKGSCGRSEERDRATEHVADPTKISLLMCTRSSSQTSFSYVVPVMQSVEVACLSHLPASDPSVRSARVPVGCGRSNPQGAASHGELQVLHLVYQQLQRGTPHLGNLHRDRNRDAIHGTGSLQLDTTCWGYCLRACYAGYLITCLIAFLFRLSSAQAAALALMTSSRRPTRSRAAPTPSRS